ncbi:DUF423 domain-containing protein [Fundidesulfovibrio terrae]|uniref:DUF423 domain-containing protein n=1 Tax=Fundidesulfovibrio terrae TaxID=2922866 RepID=UPI001FAF89DF|nr:DUF423 domain-containing protein [Fundidesulfovibrio terrae]
MPRIFFAIGSIFAFISVGAGALGSHALKGKLTPDLLPIFEIGVRYQMHHALALIGVGLACAKWPSTLMTASGWLFIVGTVFFSGSIYQHCLTGTRWLEMITPIGGSLLMLGWICAAVAALRAS